MTGISLDELTELQPPLEKFWPTLEDLKSDLRIAIEKMDRTDELMAKMLTNLTSTEAEAVKAELQAISVEMNGIIGKRMIGHNRGAVYLAVQVFGTYMAAFKGPNRHLTPEQIVALRATGATTELLTVKKS